MPRRSPLAALLAPLSMLSMLAACGNDETSTTSTTLFPPDAAPVTTVAGVDAAAPPENPDKPDVKLPASLPSALVRTVLAEGAGQAAAAGDTLVVNYVGVRSEDGTEFDNSYDKGEPLPVSLGAGSVIKGWDQGLAGSKAGERVQLDIPAELAYGDTPKGDIIQPGDALTFVIDVLAVVPPTDQADKPTDVSIPTSTGATELVIDDLVVGDGNAAIEGDTVAIQAIIYRGDNGDTLTDTWTGTAPVSLVLSADQALPGIAEGIIGMKVGGRRLVVIPAAKAFGAEGNTNASVPPDTDIVLLVDLFAAY